MSANEISQEFFINHWAELNKKNELPLLFNPHNKSFYTPIDTNGDMVRVVLLNSKTEEWFQKEWLITIEDFSRLKNEKQSGKHQQFISNPSAIHQGNIEVSSENNQKKINKNSGSNPVAIKEKSDKDYIRIEKKSMFVLSRTNDELTIKKIDDVVIDSEVCKISNNVEGLKENYKTLANIENRQGGLSFSRQFLRPETNDEILKKHKPVIKLLKKNKVIREATRNYYSSFNQLPEHVPKELVNYLFKEKIKNPSGRKKNPYYSISTLTRIVNVVKEKDKQNRLKRLKIFKVLVVILMIIGSLRLLIYIYYQTKQTETKTDQPITIIQNTLNADSLINAYCVQNKITLTIWRKQQIKKSLDTLTNTQLASEIIKTVINKEYKKY